MRSVDLAGKKITVLGASRSGTSAASLLQHTGAEIFASEISRAEDMAEAMKIFDSANAGYEFGGHTDRVFDADFTVVSPGIPESAPIMEAMIERGIPIYSEVECASWFTDKVIIAITGTNGKTTCTALLGSLLSGRFSDVRVGGNIGTPFSSIVTDEESNETVYILEVSSFQLRWIDKFHPKAATILNVSRDHIDWHSTMADYIAAKERIIENMTGDDYFVYNADDRESTRIASESGCRIYPFSMRKELAEGCYFDGENILLKTGEGDDEVLPRGLLRLKGAHNISNVLACTLTAALMDVRGGLLTTGLSGFEAIEHRLETVRTLDGITYVNDSKATNVNSMAVGLKSFTEPLTVIAGGRDKGGDFTEIGDIVEEKVRSIVLIGEAADKIEEQLKNRAVFHRADDMRTAVRLARDISSEGDVVLLSPGCASYDMFENYEERGNVFKREAMALEEEAK